jgi:ribose transport system substrate-binding protein
MKTRRAGIGALALASLAFAAVGCGSSGSTATSTATKSADHGSVASSADKQVTVQQLPYAHSYTGPDKAYLGVLSKPAVKDGQAFKVGYSQINDTLNVLNVMAQGSADAAKQFGGSQTLLSSNNDTSLQVSQFNQLLTTGSDAIVAYPQIPGGLSAGVKQANAQHVPVVYLGAVNNAAEPPPADEPFSVNTAIDYACYVTMKALAAKLPSGATFAISGFGQPVPMLDYLTERLKYWGPKFGLKWVTTVNAAVTSPGADSTAASQILTKYPHVNVILAFNDDSAVAAATAAKALHLPNVKVATADGGDPELIPLVKAGSVIVDYLVPWGLEGQQAAYAAYAELTGQDKQLPKFMLVPGVVATKDNVNNVKFTG